jgi:hypothetical protein
MGTYSYIIPSEFRQKNILYTTLFSGANNDVFNNELDKTIFYITRQDTAHIGITYINGLSPSDQTLLNTFMDGYTWVAFETISNIGPAGEQGIQGVTGQNGTAGEQGIQGIQGANGVGREGPSGGAGPSGAAGLLGATGTSGVKGAIGTTGQQGIQGIIGTTGLLGATGTSGVQGATGIQGYTGATGATGIQGATGVGTSGPPGPPGATGAVGPTGETDNPFDQDLNTTDNVLFNNLNVISVTSTSVNSTSVQTNSVQTTSLQASTVVAGSLTIGSVPNNFIINQGRGNTGEYLQTDGGDGTSWQPFPTKPYGSQTFNDNGSETEIKTEGVFVSVVGARNIPPLLPLSLLRDFTSTTTGLQYTGAVTKIFNVNSSITWELDSSNNGECEVAIFLNTDVNPVPGTKQRGYNYNNYPRNVFVTAIISLKENDIVDIKVTNASSTDGIIVSNFSFCISYIDDL